MAEAGLHDLDRLPVSDQQRGIKVPQGVKAGPRGRARSLHSRTPNVRESSAADRIAGVISEQEAIGTNRVAGEVSGQGVEHDSRQRHDPVRLR